ncbi:ORF1a polyprotein [Tetterwort vein chlorosis virus]|uniref:ORF1a polyprotein n=1 Tax=Tetterwort vein chlorosis virus TaxID=1712389 RepID=A0A0M4MYI6_9CLOS|nr:ORF1a polyprotein [Tetterwort vein chlorosis virus]ALE18213.1 ORF1a polyprotein [Tetterwort vein chlorosis virus]
MASTIVSRTHPLLPRGMAIPPCGVAYFLKCVPSYWRTSIKQNKQNYKKSKNLKTNKTRRVTQTKLSRTTPAAPFATHNIVLKRSFKERLVYPGINPVNVKILDNGNAVFIPISRVDVNRRLNVLRQLCNIPHCTFKRLPRAVVYKLGYNVDKINETIDDFLNREVGALPSETVEPDTVIQGKTRFNDGYKLFHFISKSYLDIYFLFNNYCDSTSHLKFRMQYKQRPDGTIAGTKVSTLIHGIAAGSHLYCDDFNLKARLDNRQFQAKMILLSILDRIPDYAEKFQVYLGAEFRKRVPRARDIIFATGRRMEEAGKRRMRNSAVGAEPKRVSTTDTKKTTVQVIWSADKRQREFFVVKIEGKEDIKIYNNKFCIANMYNATLNKGKFFIHPKCYTPFLTRFGEHTREYCWINAFALANMQMPRELVPYPTLKYGYLLGCGLGKVLRGRVMVIGPNLCHFDKSFNIKNATIPYFMSMGVKLENDVDGWSKNIEVLFDDISAGIITQTNLRSENRLMDTITARLSDRINQQCSKKKDLIISTCLSSKDKKELAEIFPEINFDFTDSNFSSHALATAMRHSENYLMAKRHNFNSFVDIGGDVVHYLHELVSNVHVCSPVVDIKDAHRHMTRSNQLDRMKGMNESITLCDNLAQNCCIEMQNLIAVQVYDMTLVDMAKALQSHKSKRLDFSVIIPPEIVEDDCDVSIFSDSVRVTCEGERVRYDYGDAGESYYHDRDNLIDILKTQIFEVNGVVYKKTLECSRKQLHFFSVVPCLDIANGKYKVTSHYSKSETDKLLVRVPVENEDGEKEHIKIKMDKAAFHHLVEYSMNTVLRLDEKAFEYLLSQYRARKSISIKGGRVTQMSGDLPPKVVSGFIGAVIGYGLRLREHAHKSAKLSYHEFYTPSIYRILCKIIARILQRLYNWTHDKLISVMKCCLNKDFFNEVTVNQCGVYEFQGEYSFTQHVNITGQDGNSRILSSSFERFKKYNETMYDNLDAITADNQQLFSKDPNEILSELFELGGGRTNDRFIKKGCVYISELMYIKIHKFIFNCTKSLKSAKTYTNFICGAFEFFKRHSISIVGFVKDFLVSLFRSITSGVKQFSKGQFDAVKSAALATKDFLKNLNADWEEAVNVALKKERTDSYTNPSDISKSEGSSVESHEEMQRTVEEDLASLGGGGRTIVDRGINWCRRTKFFSNLLRSIKSKLLNLLRDISKFFSNMRINARWLKNRLYSMIERLFDEENFSVVISGVCFTVTSLLFMVLTGGYNPLRFFIALFFLMSVRIFGYEKAITGGGIGTSIICHSLAGFGWLGPMTIPLKAVVFKCLESRLKRYVRRFKCLERTSDLMVAKDVLSRRYYNFLTIQNVRLLCIFLICRATIPPRFSLVMLMIVIGCYDYAQYLSTYCVKANVFISYQSRLMRTTPSKRYKVLKEIFVSKFNRNNIKVEEEKVEDSDVDFASSAQMMKVGSRMRDSDVEVEFDYDGSYVEKSKIHNTWGSECSTSKAADRVDGLIFSTTRPTEDRTQINCVVHFPISHTMLDYPMTNTFDFNPTGVDEIDCVCEFYYLEAKKLHTEIGKLDNAVRICLENQLQEKRTRDVVWHLRNMCDDASLYVSNGGDEWYRLKKGDKGSCVIEGQCKITLDNALVDFNTRTTGLQLCSDEMIGLFANKKCLALEQIIKRNRDKFTDVRNRDVVFFNKPPGAGKTTTIVRNMLDDVKARVTSIALTYTSNGKKEIIDKLKKQGVPNAQTMVFTYDSVLVNGTEAVVDKIYCDEIFMVHAGEWIAIMSLFKTKFVRCYGDRNQIPFINRVPHTLCVRHKDIYLTFKTIDDNVSYRCPVDVCHLLSTLTDAKGDLLYPKGVYAAGENRKILRSIEVEPFNSIDELDHDFEGKSITFTRPEREDVNVSCQKMTRKQISVQTVHEVQGGTFPKVYLYRLRKYDNPLYEDINQFVVSISRHTELMRYRVLSDKMFDKISTSIGALNKVQDYVLKEFMFKQRV